MMVRHPRTGPEPFNLLSSGRNASACFPCNHDSADVTFRKVDSFLRCDLRQVDRIARCAQKDRGFQINDRLQTTQTRLTAPGNAKTTHSIARIEREPKAEKRSE